MNLTGYTSVPFDFEATVTFEDPGDNLTGGAVRVDAINVKTAAKVAGSAVIMDADTVRAQFAAGDLAEGLWEVQLMVTPLAGIARIAKAFILTIKPGAA